MAQTCLSPSRKSAFLGSALVKPGERVRKSISFSLWGLQISLQQEVVLVSPTWGGWWSLGTTPIFTGVGKLQGSTSPTTAHSRVDSPGLSLCSPSGSPGCRHRCLPAAPPQPPAVGQGELQDRVLHGAVPGTFPVAPAEGFGVAGRASPRLW